MIKIKVRILPIIVLMAAVIASSGCRTSGVGLNAAESSGDATSARTALLPLRGHDFAADTATTGQDAPGEPGNEPEPFGELPISTDGGPSATQLTSEPELLTVNPDTGPNASVPERLAVLENFLLSGGTNTIGSVPGGHARWSGRMQGYQFNRPPNDDPFVEGRATLDFGLSTNLLDVKFSEVGSRDGKRSLSDFGFEDLPVTVDKTFAHSDDSGHLYGAFFGPADEEAAGSFRHNETDIFGSFSARRIPDVLPSLVKAAKAIPRLVGRSVTQSANTNSSNITTDNAGAVFDRGQLALTVTRQDGTGFSLDSNTDTLDTHPGIPIRSDQIAREWQLEKKFAGGAVKVRSFGEMPSNQFPLRAIHSSGNWGMNPEIVRAWEANGRKEPLVSLDHIAYLKSLNVNWVGLSVALHYDDSMDSTVERVYSGVRTPTFRDDVLKQFIREFRSHGIDVYLTLAFEAHEAETAGRPVHRWQLGDPGQSATGIPSDDPNVVGRISSNYWPWNPDHPDHQRFVAEFFKTYADQAVHFARIAQEEGVKLYSLGTETDRLFRTRSGNYWPNDFRQELESMVARVRDEYSGKLTYDMHYDVLPDTYFFGPGSNHLWEDLNLDIIGVSAWAPLTDSPPSTVMSVESLQAAWEKMFKEHLIPLAERNPGRPIVFLEHGAHDVVQAPRYPASRPSDSRPFIFTDTDGNGLDDGRETQANMYQALLDTMKKYPGVVNGVFWWDNFAVSDALWADFPATQRNWFIRDKPSEDVVRSAYESWADWLTGGYWMHVADNLDLIDAGAFVDGPELGGAPTFPYRGTATYQGFAAGGFAAVYGTDDPDVSPGSHEVGEYEGQLLLTADFRRRRISGQIQKIHVSGIHTPLVGTSRPFANIPVPYEFNLGAARFNSRGFTGNTTVTSTNPEIRIADSDGSWGGKFSIVPDDDGNPRVVAGTHGEEFTATGGTRAGFIGVFAGATN